LSELLQYNILLSPSSCAVRRTLGGRRGLLVFQKVELSQQALTHTLTPNPTQMGCLAKLLRLYCG